MLHIFNPEEGMPYEPKRADLAVLPFSLDSEDDAEPTRVITVRVPRSLHSALKDQAHAVHTTLNSLCISRLITDIQACPILPGGAKPPRHDFAQWHMDRWAESQRRLVQSAVAATNGQPAATAR